MTRQALLLFIDGLGLGADDPAVNPVVAAHTPCLDALLGRKLAGLTARFEHDGALVVPTDATLGVGGLPQSATGQTALLTGRNAPQVVGRHITAYPTKTLRGLLTDHNLFSRVKALGGTVALANAYTDEYFARVEAGEMRHAAITFSALAAGIPLRGVEDLQQGRAVFHDLTNARPRSWGYDVPAITPHQAGKNLAGIAAGCHLTVFEFFLTDLSAHHRIDQPPAAVVTMVDALLAGVLETTDLSTMLVMLTSDHGNIEDGRVDTHTRNPIPTLLVGHGRRDVGERITALTDITPALVGWLAEAIARG